MPESVVEFKPIGRRGMHVRLRTEHGWELEATGDLDVAVPELAGAPQLQGNHVLTTNAWAFACAEKSKRVTRDRELAEELSRRVEIHRDLALRIADLVDKVGERSRTGWCSACFERTTHHRVEAALAVPTYLCDSCGAATLKCVAPSCDNMATRGFGTVRIPRYCAEHRHDLPSFERSADRIDELSGFGELLRYEKRNLAKTSKLALSGVVTAGAMTGVGLLGAPLIGGVLGSTLGGYSGAAATSYGLALLGGGSIASGGFGMLGGTAVVAAAGGSLGGALGAGLTNAYVREDKSFDIRKLKDGSGVPVVVCSGFLTEETLGWGDWRRIVTERYPDSPVYRVHWGAEELRDLAAVLGVGMGKTAALKALKKAAMSVTKKGAAQVGPIGGALVVVDLVKNPWWRARERAMKTGAALADLIARTDMDQVVLIGHSLGARAMVAAAEALATKPSAPSVREMHLLGAAVAANRDWSTLNRAVEESVFNYHSLSDKVLKFFYSVAQVGSNAAGYGGMRSKQKKIKNIDVTAKVADHSVYCKDLSLA